MIKTSMLSLSILLCCLSCGITETEQSENINTDTIAPSVSPTDSMQRKAMTLAQDTSSANRISQTYQNKRFRNVKVQKLANDSFLITGQGQIFEASFNWVIEDGHEELQHSYSTTDAGAPEWGNFSFKVHAPKKRPTSTLHLVLFETSAKDGSRQYELPVLLH